MFRQKTFSVFLAALFFLAPLSRGYEAVDALGRKFEFSKPPVCATIVPAVTQNIFAIGADSFLVANSRFCVYPEGAKRKIKLGGYIDPDYEKIAELKPEIFILPSTADSRVERRLAKLGIKCFVLNAEGIENIAADIRLLGALFDKRSEAEKCAAEFERLISRSDEGRGRSALFMFGKMAAGKGSFVGGLLEAWRLKNCAEKIGRPWAGASARVYFIGAARDSLCRIRKRRSAGGIGKILQNRRRMARDARRKKFHDMFCPEEFCHNTVFSRGRSAETYALLLRLKMIFPKATVCLTFGNNYDFFH